MYCVADMTEKHLCVVISAFASWVLIWSDSSNHKLINVYKLFEDGLSNLYRNTFQLHMFEKKYFSVINAVWYTSMSDHVQAPDMIGQKVRLTLRQLAYFFFIK